MSRVISSVDHGIWLTPGDGTTPDAAGGTYNFLAGPGTDILVKVYDSLGVPPIGTRVPFVIPFVRNTGGAGAAYDYTWVVRGCDAIPTPPPLTSPNWTAVSALIKPQCRATRAFSLSGTPQQEYLHVWRYYLIYISSTTVAPGGDVEFGLKFVRRG